MENDETIQLGKKYVDKITRFEGVATGHATYLNSCSQTLLEGDSEHKFLSQWVEDKRLELVR